MVQTTMYPGKINSPATTLDGGINDSVTTITVADSTVFPAGPNLAVIGTGEDAETIRYTDISGNDLTGCTREFQGTAKSWDSGTAISRNFTAYDHDTFRANIEDLAYTQGCTLVNDGDTIPHNCGGTPLSISVSDSDDKFQMIAAPKALWNSTTFTIYVKTNFGDPGVQQWVSWKAKKP